MFTYDNPCNIDFGSNLSDDQRKFLRELLDAGEEYVNSQLQTLSTEDEPILSVGIGRFSFKARERHFHRDKNLEMQWFQCSHRLILRRRGNNKPGCVLEVVADEQIGEEGSYGKALKLIGKIKKVGEDSVEFVKYGMDTENGYLVKEQDISLDKKVFLNESNILSLANLLCSKPSSHTLYKGFAFMRKLPGIDLFDMPAMDSQKSQQVRIGSGAAIVESLLTLTKAYHDQLDGKIIHRDVKNENIKVEVDKNKITKATFFDFGLSLKHTEKDVDTLGTPTHIPLELIKKSASASIKSDMYSLGISYAQFICKILNLPGLAQQFNSETQLLQTEFRCGNLEHARLRYLNWLKAATRNGLDNYTDLSTHLKTDLYGLIDSMLADDPDKRPDPREIINTLQEMQETILMEKLDNESCDILLGTLIQADELKKALKQINKDARANFKCTQSLADYSTKVEPALTRLLDKIKQIPSLPAGHIQEAFVDRLGVKAFAKLKDVQAMQDLAQKAVDEFKQYIEKLQEMQNTLATDTTHRAAKKAALAAELNDIFLKVSKRNLTIDDLIYLNRRFAFRIAKLASYHVDSPEDKYKKSLSTLNELMASWQKPYINAIIADVEFCKANLTPGDDAKLQMLTEALDATAAFVTDPANIQSIKRFDSAANAVGQHSATKRAASAMFLLGGITLIGISLGLAVATFGTGAPVSALLTTLGIAMIATAVTGATTTVIASSIFNKELIKPVERKMDDLKSAGFIKR